MRKLTVTALTMIRGEQDVAFSSLYHNASLGFDKFIIVSHVDFPFIRQCVDLLRHKFPSTQFGLVEISDPTDFSRMKGTYVNHTLNTFLKGGEINVVYCFDADEFLNIGRFSDVHAMMSAYLDAVGPRSLEKNQSPCLMVLPWVNLLPADSVGASEDVDLFSPYLLYRNYFELSGNNGSFGTKVIFRKSSDAWIHMGFHWVINPTTSTKWSSTPQAVEFVQQERLSVRHLPIRNFDQFIGRIKTYVESATQSEKYNVIAKSFGVSKKSEALRELFEKLADHKTPFQNIREANFYFNGNIDNKKLGQFADFLVGNRTFSGKILLPKAEILRHDAGTGIN